LISSVSVMSIHVSGGTAPVMKTSFTL